MIENFVTIDETEILERLGEFCGDADEANLAEFLPQLYTPAIIGVTDTKQIVYSASRMYTVLTNNGKSPSEADNEMIMITSQNSSDTSEYKPFIVYDLPGYNASDTRNRTDSEYLKDCIRNHFKNIPDVLNKIGVLDDYATSIIGIGEEYIFYDQDEMIQYLLDVENMTEEEAWDYFSYNTERAMPYINVQVEKAPIIVYNFIDNY